MEKVEVTYGNTLRVWWSFMWRVSLVSGSFGLILGVVGTYIIGPFVEPETRPMIFPIISSLVYISVSIWAINEILSKKYKTFSVALIKEGSD